MTTALIATQGGPFDSVVLYPSGDTTGVADKANFDAAMAQIAASHYLPP
jgi:hypothetical protein